jgi:hypothetical protein
MEDADVAGLITFIHYNKVSHGLSLLINKLISPVYPEAARDQ